jgi:type I restriction enzyme M protein
MVETPSGVLFDLAQVETWLIENGKIASRVPIAQILWRALDAFLGDLMVDEFGRFVNSALVYLEVCERAATGRLPGLDPGLTWSDVRERPDLLGALRRAASEIEDKYPRLRGLIVDGFAFRRHPPANAVAHVLDLLERVTRDDGIARFELFEQMRERIIERDRFSEAWSTPHALEFLLARLTAGASTLFDPACGEGGVLLMAAVIDNQLDGPLGPRLIGWDINADACQLARTRFFLYDVEADIQCVNSLREPPLPTVDAVVLDPPYNMRDWGDAATYISERWRYGSPPPSSADMAWLQLAVEALTEHGRAFVLLPPSSLFRGGRDELIRRAMLTSGVIDAVVLLPTRLRRNTSIPLILWCLRAEGARDPRQDVLLVDASRLGTAGRSTVDLDQSEIDTLVEVLQSRSEEGTTSFAVKDVIAVKVSPDELVQRGTLNPSYYFPTEIVEHDDLVLTRSSALADLRTSERRARECMAALLDALGGDR